jgi:hypothetical protein
MAGAVAVAGAGAAVLGSASTAAAAQAFAHPGMLHTQADLDRMAAKVKAGADRWKQGYAKLAANSHAQSGWNPNPQATVYRGGGTPENYGTLYNDVHAAYQNALRWHITGEAAYGNTARDILNAWSAKLTKLDGTADVFIAAGVYGYEFANAAELMRGYTGFDLARFQKMMLTVFYPKNHDFLVHHNGAFVTNYWGSWDLLTVASVLAIGILCDDKAKVEEAVAYFKSGAGNGSIKNAINVIHPGGLGQVVEVGRDQGHALLSIGLMATICEMAWNQGIDLYGYDDNRFLKGAEYAAKWNLGQNVPYTPYTWKYGAPGVWAGQETLTAASENSRGQARPIWEGIYNHYVNRRGLDAPFVTAIAAKVRPEGGGGDYGSGGGFDHLGFGTLTFTREAGDATTATKAPSSTATGATSSDSSSGAVASAAASASPSASGGGVQAQGGSGDLAVTGAGDVAAIAGTGVLAIVGGLIALRRRSGTRQQP